MNPEEQKEAASNEIADYLRQEQARERERERSAPAAPYAASSFSARHESGVLYQGEFETPSDGTGLAVRRHAAALAATGVPLLLRSFSNAVINSLGVAEPVYARGLPDEIYREVGHLLQTDMATCRPVIKHVVIRSAEHCRRLLMPRGAIPVENTLEAQMAMRDAIYSNTIVYSVWERDRIDDGIARQLAMVKQCWVPCQQNARLLTGAGVPADRVHVVPHPYADDDMIHIGTRRHRGQHGDWRLFYSIGRWEPRKGFAELIDAFVRAFKPTDKVRLVIKYTGDGNWPEYPTPDEATARAAQAEGWSAETVAKRVQLIDGRIERSMIVKLHVENNIYVSASHGEAWGLPAYDAKLAGNALVYVPFGGIADFAEDSDLAIPSGMGAAHSSYRWEHGAQWASYSQDALIEGLRRARQPEDFRRPPGYEQRFSMVAVGSQMRQLVDAAIAPDHYLERRP